MNALTDLQRDVLDRGLFDFVGLWEVVATVSATRPDASADDVLDICLGAIRPLVRDSLMEPGEMVDGEFMARPGELEAIIDQLRAVYDGDLMGVWQYRLWLSNTAVGDRVAGRARHRSGDDGR